MASVCVVHAFRCFMLVDDVDRAGAFHGHPAPKEEVISHIGILVNGLVIPAVQFIRERG